MCLCMFVCVLQVLTFKEISWQSLRIEADAIGSEEQDLGNTPLRLITNQGRIRIALKRRVISYDSKHDATSNNNKMNNNNFP